MSRERKLSDQKRGGGASETETETNEASCADEHADVLSASLDTDTNEHDDGTAEDGPSSTEAITSVGSEGKSANTTDGLCRSQLVASTKNRDTYLNSVEDTEQRTLGLVEVILPQFQGLQTVHHTAIVSVGHRRDEGEELQGCQMGFKASRQSIRTHDDQGQLCKESSVESGIPSLHELSQVGCH